MGNCPVCRSVEGFSLTYTNVVCAGCRALLNQTPFGVKLIMNDAAERFPEILQWWDSRHDITEEEIKLLTHNNSIMSLRLQIEKKAKMLLQDMMGQDIYDKFIKDGKTHIESGKNTYILYLDGRIINKTTNQRYCIIPDKPDYPNDDILAIKFAWLKYGIDTVERAAVKSAILERPAGIGAGLIDYAPGRYIDRIDRTDRTFAYHMNMQGRKRTTDYR